MIIAQLPSSPTLIDVTRNPYERRIVPILEEIMPFPIPLITPPVTRMYFIATSDSRSKSMRKKRNNQMQSRYLSAFLPLTKSCPFGLRLACIEEKRRNTVNAMLHSCPMTPNHFARNTTNNGLHRGDRFAQLICTWINRRNSFRAGSPFFFSPCQARRTDVCSARP